MVFLRLCTIDLVRENGDLILKLKFLLRELNVLLLLHSLTVLLSRFKLGLHLTDLLLVVFVLLCKLSFLAQNLLFVIFEFGLKLESLLGLQKHFLVDLLHRLFVLLLFLLQLANRLLQALYLDSVLVLLVFSFTQSLLPLFQLTSLFIAKLIKLLHPLCDLSTGVTVELLQLRFLLNQNRQVLITCL